MSQVNKPNISPLRSNDKKDTSVNPKDFQKSVDKAEKIDPESENSKKKSSSEFEEEISSEDDDLTIKLGTIPFKDLMTAYEKGSSVYDAEQGSSPNLVAEGQIKEEDLPSYIPAFSEKNEPSRLNIQSNNSNNTFLQQEDFQSDNNFLPNSEEESENNIFNKPQPLTGSSTSFDQNNNNFSSQNQFNHSDEPKKSSTPSNSENKKTSKTKIEQNKKKSTTKKTKNKSKKTQETDKTKKQETPQSIENQKLDKKPDISDTQKDVLFSQSKNTDEQDQKEKKTASISNENSQTDNDEGTITTIDSQPSSSQDQQHDDTSSSEQPEDMIVPETMTLEQTNETAQVKLAPFINIPKDVFALFEKMVGLITMEKENGKSTTTVTLSLPNSIFDKGELVLEHYDTAPNTYNVQFLGSPEAVAKFAKNMQGLNNAAAEAKLSFSINLLPPKLSKNYTNAIETSDEQSDQQQDQQQKDGKKKKK